jgi:four helix bundle protein
MAQLEELRVWQAAMDLATTVYRVTLDEPLVKHFGLIDQLRRTAVSVPSNIAEGYGLGTKPQLIRTLRLALGSARESDTQLQIVCRLQLLDAGDLRPLSDLCNTVIGMLVNLLKSLGSQLKH